MSRLMRIFVLVFVAPLAALADVTFVHWSDVHVNTSDPLPFRRRIVDDMNTMPGKHWPAAIGGGTVGPIDFVLATGDITDSGAPGEWDGYLALRRRIHFPSYETMGNHDFRQGRTVENGISRFHGNSYYSFNKGGVHIVILNEYTAHDRLPDFNDAQLDWLARDLAKIQKGVTPVVLAMHSPPIRTGNHFSTIGSSINRFVRILDGHKAVILHGHRHQAEIHRLDGKWWVLGSGQSVNPDLPDRTEYNVIRVADDGRVTCVTYNWKRQAWDLDGGSFHMDLPATVRMDPAVFKVDADSAIVRSGPALWKPMVGTIGRGVKYVVNARSADGAWKAIWWKGDRAWVRSSAVTTSYGTGVAINVPDLSVRSGPSTTSSRLGVVHSPQIYVRVDKSGTWHKVNWGGRTVWVNGDYVKLLTLGTPPPTPPPPPPTPPPTGSYPADYLTTASPTRVRSGPGGTYSVLGTYGSGVVVTVKGKTGEWYRVTYQGQTGWIHDTQVKTLPAGTAPALRVMSFNIRVGTANDGINRWDLRKGLCVSRVTAFSPDVMGVQEDLHFQNDYFQSKLPGYGRVGVGADDGRLRGEMVSIYFRKERLQLLDSGTFWLSLHPNVPGSRGWDAMKTRIATWARFRDRMAGGRELLYVNTHFDHIGDRARAESGKMIRNFIEGHALGRPALVTGDFNAPPYSLPYRNLVRGGSGDVPFTDTWHKLYPKSDPGTAHGWDARAGARIDWILCSRSFQVKRAAIDRYHIGNRWPSDHFPINAVVAWPQP